MCLKVRFGLAAWLLATVLQGAAAPSISTFTPTYAEPNSTTFITILGSGFSNPVDVRFNGVRDTSAQAVNASTIQARVPAAAPPGSGPISVTSGGATALSLQNFTVVGPGPWVQSFTPDTGADGAVVTFVGMHFSELTNVTFNGRSVPNSLPPPSDTMMQLNAPAGVTTGPIVLRSWRGLAFTTTNFYVPPQFKGFSPVTARPGTNIVVTGTNFTGTTAVLFKGAGGSLTVPSSFTVLSNNAVRVTVPVGALTGPFRLEAPAGAMLTGTNTITILPLITGFSPNSGGPNTAVLITGSNLNDGTNTVKFNGVTATTSGASYGQLTAYVPAAATTGPVSIQNTNGTYTTAENFYIPPSITSFTPTNSPPGSRIQITGVNFLGATVVQFDNLAATAFYVTNNTTIGAVVPTNVSTGVIRVFAPAGLAVSSGYFYAPPIITDFSPTLGIPGTTVTLTGSNFLGTSAVLFSGQPAATYTVVNNTTILATVPNGAQNGPLTVVAPAGTNVTVTSFTLDYTADLTITATDAPDPVFATSNLVYSVNVANNGPFTAANVRVTNALPANCTLINVIPSQGSFLSYSNVVVANLGSVQSANSAGFFIYVSPKTAGNIELLSSVSSDYTDPQPANNHITTLSTVLPLPLLSIRSVSDRVRLSWPAALSDYSLQYRTPDPGTSTWLQVTSPTMISGDYNIVTETNAGLPRFYRLIK